MFVSGVFPAWPPVSCQMDDCRNKRNVKAIKVCPRSERSVAVAAPVSQSRRFGCDCILSELSHLFPPNFAVSSTGVWIKLILRHVNLDLVFFSSGFVFTYNIQALYYHNMIDQVHIFIYLIYVFNPFIEVSNPPSSCRSVSSSILL